MICVRVVHYGRQELIFYHSAISTHTARKVPNFFQTLLNHIQGWEVCQKKQQTSRNINLVAFCAKIPLKLKNLQKCLKRAKNCMFFEVFRTLLKCSPIWAQKANACTKLELSCLFWYPYHLWKWLSSGDIAVFKIFLQIFLLQRHLVTVFHKWKINFKVFVIDFGTIWVLFLWFWWPNQKKCLIALSRDTSLWKELTVCPSHTDFIFFCGALPSCSLLVPQSVPRLPLRIIPILPKSLDWSSQSEKYSVSKYPASKKDFGLPRYL
jgi:hypothetical protein